MKRLARWTLNTLTALALLLCVAMAWLWVRSYTWSDIAGCVTVRRTFQIQSVDGAAGFGFMLGRVGPDGCYRHTVRVAALGYAVKGPGPFRVRLLGRHQWAIIVGDFWLMIATFALPLARAREWSVRRRGRGHCSSCGYDLTGNISGVCPECGTKIAQNTV